MKAIVRRVVRLEDQFDTRLSDKAKSSVRIIVTLAGSEPASLATSTCTRHVRAGILTEVVQLDGARGSISGLKARRIGQIRRGDEGHRQKSWAVGGQTGAQGEWGVTARGRLAPRATAAAHGSKAANRLRIGHRQIRPPLPADSFRPPRRCGSAASAALRGTASYRRPTLIRNVSRRLERLEDRAAASARNSICFRIHFVDPEKGLTRILVLESGKPSIHVEPTPEEVERVRADLERRRAARLLRKRRLH